MSQYDKDLQNNNATRGQALQNGRDEANSGYNYCSNQKDGELRSTYLAREAEFNKTKNG